MFKSSFNWRFKDIFDPLGVDFSFGLSNLILLTFYFLFLPQPIYLVFPARMQMVKYTAAVIEDVR